MSAEEDKDFDARDFLCYFLLRELEAAQPEGRSVTRTQFLKLSCIADRRLFEKYNIDIDLPRYWYQYGEILNEEPISNSTYTVTPGEWDGKKVQPAPGISRDSFTVPGEIRQPLYSVVRQVAYEFAGKDTQEIKDHQYDEYAPTEFIRTFDEFREFIIDQDRQNASLADFATGSLQSPEDQAKELLDNLLAEYPVELYSEMYELFLRWDDTTRLLLEEGDFEAAEELLDDFWETFSKVELRHHHEQNTPENQQIRWVNERDDETASFRTRLTEMREELLSNREPSGTLQSIAQSDIAEDTF